MERIAALDTGPLLLWLAGRTDPLIIARFKHLSMFEVDDFELLQKLLEAFNSIVATPHVLTEVSNHAHHLKGALGTALLESFTEFSRVTQEHYKASSVLSQSTTFIKYGVTDSALVDLADIFTVITDDFRLAGYLSSQGKRVINFNHLRQSRLLP